MKCRELAEFLFDYVSGDLPSERREHFEFHLTRCSNCHEYLVQYQMTIKAGRIACGDTELDTLKRLYANSDWLHKETTRLGRHLAAQIPLGPYLSITVTDASHVGLALASALTVAGEYEGADALLADKALLDSWINHQWHQLGRAYLMFVTQRWPDGSVTGENAFVIPTMG